MSLSSSCASDQHSSCPGYYKAAHLCACPCHTNPQPALDRWIAHICRKLEEMDQVHFPDWLDTEPPDSDLWLKQAQLQYMKTLIDIQQNRLTRKALGDVTVEPS